MHKNIYVTQISDIAQEFTIDANTVSSWNEIQKNEKIKEFELRIKAKIQQNPENIESITKDIEEIVVETRFSNWQGTSRGKRDIKQAIRKTLFKYKLHNDEKLIENLYSLICEYY